MLPWRIMLVDEEASYRWDLTKTLEMGPGLRVVAEASNAHEALRQVETRRPDLALIARRLPGLTGLQVSAAIRRHQAHSRVVVLTPAVAYDQCLAAVRAGAAGILPRHADSQQVRTTVRAVLTGGDLVKTWDGCDGLTALAATADGRSPQAIIDTLTIRELEAFDCLLMGMSTKETASTLNVADQTVKNRVSGVLHKLRVENRMAAIRLALAWGWADYGPDPSVSTLASPRVDDSQPRIPPTLLPTTGEYHAWA